MRLPIIYTLFNKDGSEFHYENYFYRPETYEQAFKEAGFKQFSWHPVEVDSAGKLIFGEQYWEELISHPPMICFTALK